MGSDRSVRRRSSALRAGLVLIWVAAQLSIAPVAAVEPSLAVANTASKPALPAGASFGWASANWSGYAVTRGPYTAATATWTVPTVESTAGSTYSSTWVGIDGFTNSKLIQVGTSQNSVDGVARYAAWWEVLPANAVTISDLPVRAGDHILAKLARRSAGVWTISLDNLTTGMAFVLTTAYDGPGSSAEWIQEAPTVGSKTAALASYGTTTFRATANGRSPGFLASDGGVMVQAGLRVSLPTLPTSDRSGFTTVRTALPGASVLRVIPGGNAAAGVRLTWTAAAPNGSRVTGYRIYRRTGTVRKLLATVGSQLAFVDVRPLNNRTSAYTIEPINAIGTGPRSREVSIYVH